MRCGNNRSTPHLENVNFVPTSLETTSLSSYYDIDFKYVLQLNINDDKEYNMDNGNSIHINNVNYDDEYFEAYNIAASVHTNEAIISNQQ